jgi:hypothetical protein
MEGSSQKQKDKALVRLMHTGWLAWQAEQVRAVRDEQREAEEGRPTPTSVSYAWHSYPTQIHRTHTLLTHTYLQAAKAKAQQDRAQKERLRLKRQTKKAEAAAAAAAGDPSSPSIGVKRGRSMAGIVQRSHQQEEEAAAAAAGGGNSEAETSLEDLTDHGEEWEFACRCGQQCTSQSPADAWPRGALFQCKGACVCWLLLLDGGDVFLGGGGGGSR